MSGQNHNTPAGSSKNALDLINFPRGAIGKRGLPATRNARLPSIRNPRDLTLGGLSLGVTPKRTFVPNIPVRREKSQDSSSSSDKGKPKNIDGPHDKRRSTSERGRGRGRNRPEYVQTDGIFSEGIGSAMKKPLRSRASNESDGVPRLPKPVVPVIKKEIDDEKSDKDLLDNLLRDDFIDDGSDEERDVQQPVFLPLNCSSKDKLSTKSEPGDVKKDVVHIKKEKVEIKTEDPPPMDFVDVKPNVLVKAEPTEAGELFTSEAITEDKQLLFFQFPDVLGVPPQPEDSRSQPKNSQESSSSQETAPNSSGNRLTDFPEGYIGKLQVLKSGKTRLVLGSLVLDVKLGAPFSTLQDLVSIRTSMSGGDMTVLGHVHHKLVCMPDVENLMAQCAL